MLNWLGFVVFRKELVDHLRDRRSLLGSVLLPAVGPLLLVAVFGLVSDVQKARPEKVSVIGAVHAPELVEHLRTQGVEILPAVSDAQAAVRAGEVELVLAIPADYAERFEAGRAPQIQLFSDGSRPRALASARRLEGLLLDYARELAVLRLIARGVSPRIVQALHVQAVEVASSQKRSAQMLTFVPLLVMLAALIGGMNIAIDTTAGERERGSLEPLLNNPLSRSALVLGKWLTTTFASTVISALAVLGFVLAGALLPLAELDVRILLGPVQAAQMLLVALPLAPFGAALQMLVACTARTFKEAQTYLGLLNLVPMAPAVVLMLYPNQGELWMAWVPALAQIAAITDILEGEPLGVWRILSLWGSSLLYTSVLLFALSRLLMRERIIFGR